MAKKERLGSDPFKESLNWIQDTREEKKILKRQRNKNLKHLNVKMF